MPWLALIHGHGINGLPRGRRLPVGKVTNDCFGLCESVYDVPLVYPADLKPMRSVSRRSIAEAVLGAGACVTHWRPVLLLPLSPTIQGRIQ